jgi:hypothetical protein
VSGGGAPPPAPVGARAQRIARIAVLVVAAGAVAAAFAIAGRGGPGAAGARAAAYACPMHPEITAAAPGECPICGMALEATARAAARRAPADEPAAAALAAGAARPIDYAVRPAARMIVPRQTLAPAWIEGDGTGAALLHEDELAALAPDEAATFVPSAGADAHGAEDGAPVRIDPTPRPAPSGDAALRMVTFRFAAGAERPVGEVGWVKLAPRNRPAVIVPASAVLRSPAGPYVLVSSADQHRFEKRGVRLGRALPGVVIVAAGVDAGERVATANAPFLDAERRLGSGPIEGGVPAP